MRKTIASFVLAAGLAALPSLARATEPGEELAFSTLAAVCNIVYTPAKVVVAATGLTVGALAGFLSGGDTRSAYAFWVPTAGGSYFLTAALVPGMLERGHGSIVNVTTMVASKGVPGAGAYSASKAAVEALTRTWAAEFSPRGVRVNNVAPGPTRTEGVEAEWGETNEELGRALPLGRTAAPEEIAEAVLFLASPRSSFITGSTLHADGGGSAI